MKIFLYKGCFVLMLIFIRNIICAQQPCNDQIIMAINGKWVKRPDANMAAGNQTQIMTRIDKMQKLLQAAYPDPNGIEAAWYRSMDGYNSSVNSNATSYVLNALFKAYYCNTNVKKLLLGGETGTWFYVWANKFSWFVQNVDYFTIKEQPVYLLTPKQGELKGYPLYKGIHNENSNTGIKYSRAIVITRDGQSPYVAVTKKQYLQAFLNYNEKKLPEQLASLEKNTPVKTEEEEEAYKKTQLEKIEKTIAPDKVTRAKDYFLRGYVTDKQRKETWIAKAKKRYETAMEPVKDLLANSTEEDLQQPAILKVVDMSGFKEFSTDAESGQQLVRLNPDYFNSKLPKYVPQFLIVYWRWDKNKPAEDFKNQLEANFNFNALKEMIDK
jgi:hypothetical protein